MTDVTIRRVPEGTLVTLKARAGRAGKSLQAYLWDILVREAARPDPRGGHGPGRGRGQRIAEHRRRP